jgi:hypothetical protein
MSTCHENLEDRKKNTFDSWTEVKLIFFLNAQQFYVQALYQKKFRCLEIKTKIIFEYCWIR